jgi:N-acetylglutamate synthase-like GNAT family acetyltransferase
MDDEARRHAGADRIQVRPRPDFTAALALAGAAGLEVSADAHEPLALWGAYDGGRLAGVVSLDEDAGLPVVGWIAVDERYRGRRLGERLLLTVEREARRRGVVTLWATARAPGFFLSMGYELAPGEEQDQLLAGCRDCPQHGTSCRPRAVCKRLDEAAG